MTNIQPGWYQDPNVSTQKRWWDGTQWTDHVDAADGAPTATFVSVSTTTPFIWVLAVAPILSVLSILVLNPRQYLASSFENQGDLTAVFTPGYIANGVIGFVLYLAFVLLAFLDYRALKTRGLPRPFSWAWTFLTLWAYMIGRAVIVGRRTGIRNIAPLVVYIIVNVVSFFVIFAIFMDAVIYAINLVGLSE